MTTVFCDLMIAMGILTVCSDGIGSKEMKCDFMNYNTNDDVDLDDIISDVNNLARHLHSTIDEYGDHVSS